MFDRTRIKFGETVWHDRPDQDPLSGSIVYRDFYDRRDANRAALTELTSDAPAPLVLLGGRRSGKTSEIKYLKAHFSHHPLHRCGFVDIPWGGIRTRDELAQEILQAVRTYVQKEPGQPRLPAHLATGEAARPEAFLETLRGLLAVAPHEKLILAIDEFDSILVESARLAGNTAEARRTLDFVQMLVAHLSPHLRLLLTMAGTPRQLPDLAGLVAQSTCVPLHPFPKTDMDTMILDIVQEEHPLTEADLALVYDLSGGWPYYAKLLLACLADLPPAPDHIQAAMQLAVQHEGALQTLTNIYEVHLDDHEKQLILLLAAHHGRLTAAEMALLGREIQLAAQRLTARDVLDAAPDGQCRLRITLLAPWFRSWARYDLEVERRIAGLLHRLERADDHFLMPDGQMSSPS